jgi:uncharacterized protein YaaW (UPF0174 family)
MNTEIEAIKNGDLYALLSVCIDEDLEPLVKIITSKLSNFLDTNEEYKKHHPRHSMYHKAIGDELRLFGGNSFLNVFRGEGPPYEEIVVDVCKKLGAPFEPGQTVKNEGRLLNLYLERQWKALGKEEQDTIIAKARQEAAGETFTPSAMFKEGFKLIAPRLLLGPAGWGLAAFSVADPAFRVTIPCVLHIAYLRKKFLDNSATTQELLTNPSPPNPVAGSLLPVLAGARSVPLVIGASENEPVLSLTQVSEAPSQGWHIIGVADGGISRLNPLLQAVPSLATSGELSATKYMEVVVNGPLAQAKNSVGYRAFTVDTEGKFVENAVLHDPSRLMNIVSTATLLQIASVAVAQKHLADISLKLSEIKAAVDRIQQFQNNERRSVLTGATRYFEQVAPSVLAGELPESIRHQIEQHEADLLQVQDHLLEDIRHESREIMKAKDSDMFGSKGMQEAIRSHQRLLENLYRQLLLCIRARACGWQLLVVFPGEERLKESRKRSIQDSLDLLAETGDTLKLTDMHMRQKIKEMSSIWNSGTTLNKRKLTLLEWNDTLIDEVVLCKEQIKRDLCTAESVISDGRQPVRMIVRIENERIVATCTA